MKSTLIYIILAISLVLISFSSLAETEESLRTVAFDAALPVNVRQQAAKQLVKNSPKNTEYLILLGNLSMDKFDLGTALKSFDSLYINHLDELTKAQKCQLLRDYGKVLSFYSEYKAVRISKELLNIKKVDTLKRFDFDAYLILNNIENKGKYPNSQNKSYTKLKRIYEELKKENLLSDYWRKKYAGNIHRIKMFQFLGEMKLDSVIAESKKIMDLAVSASDSTSAILGIANAYFHLGRYDIAEAHYLKAINEIEYNLNTPPGIINYLRMLLDMGRYSDLIEISEKESEKIIGTGVDLWITHYYYYTGKGLLELGQFEEGSQYIEKSLLGMNELYFNASTAYESLTEFELDEVLNDNLVDKDRARTRGWWMMAMGVVIVAILGVSAILWRRLRRERDANKVLKEKYENDSERFDTQHRELTTMSLQLAKLQSVVDEAKKSLGKQDRDADHVYSILREAVAETETWNSFKLYFEGCHPKFMKNLYEKHPQLSENDVRTCVYILMNFTTKEIASLTNRTVRTVEQHKYRLGKKLVLEPNTSLLEHLRQLL